MSGIDHWLLPEGIGEMLPEQAWRMERLRRRLLDAYRAWGYGLIIPPMVEFLESLLTGTGHDLDLQTFKLTDQLTGRLLGVRADMTPQAARIDAHALKREEPVRLCYLGTVLHTRPDGFAGSRSPLQVGCELFGHAGIESDLEILGLMLETLKLTGIERVHLDLGHVGIFRGLTRGAGLSMEQEADLFDVLQRKALPEVEALLDSFGTAAPWRERLACLATLHGGDEVLGQARAKLAGAGDAVAAALDNLAAIAAQVQARWPRLPLHFDLAELRGYGYQTGVVFAAFVPGCGQEIARGGRYDQIGEVFGRARPATGFSADLRTLMALSQEEDEPRRGAVYAPAEFTPALAQTIAELRAAGEQVICALPGQTGNARALGCDRELAQQGGGWVVKKL
ncbi:MAG TPA: ATP phosphoribosyltransferase regulatory subunit [Gammaproteobacteria bacterium]